MFLSRPDWGPGWWLWCHPLCYERSCVLSGGMASASSGLQSEAAGPGQLHAHGDPSPPHLGLWCQRQVPFPETRRLYIDGRSLCWTATYWADAAQEAVVHSSLRLDVRSAIYRLIININNQYKVIDSDWISVFNYCPGIKQFCVFQERSWGSCRL